MRRTITALIACVAISVAASTSAAPGAAPPRADALAIDLTDRTASVCEFIIFFICGDWHFLPMHRFETDLQGGEGRGVWGQRLGGFLATELGGPTGLPILWAGRVSDAGDLRAVGFINFITPAAFASGTLDPAEPPLAPLRAGSGGGPSPGLEDPGALVRDLIALHEAVVATISGDPRLMQRVMTVVDALQTQPRSLALLDWAAREIEDLMTEVHAELIGQ